MFVFREVVISVVEVLQREGRILRLVEKFTLVILLMFMNK